MKLLCALLFACSLSVFCHAQDTLGIIDKVATIECPAVGLRGATCEAVTVACPEVQNYTAYLKIFTPATPVGFVMLGTGGLGTGLYEDDTYGQLTIQKLFDNGYTVAEISFGTPFVSAKTQPVQGWQVDTNGAGMRKAACRYATIAYWIKEEKTPSKPFCVSGNSAGSAVIGYGLSHYGIDKVLNFALLSSGPPFSRLDYACDDSQPAKLEYCTNLERGMGVGIPNAQQFVDPAYQPTYPAACSTSELEHSKALDYLFLPDSINSLDANLNYSITVGFLYGSLDTTGTAINEGEYYRESIVSPTLRACVSGAPHTIPDSEAGAKAIATELLENCH
jgi:hypothetical protein